MPGRYGKPGTMPFPSPMNLWAMVDAYHLHGKTLEEVGAMFQRNRYLVADLFKRAGVSRRRGGAVPGTPGYERCTAASRKGGEVHAALWRRRAERRQPPPIIHHLEPLRRTWPIGALPTVILCRLC